MFTIHRIVEMLEGYEEDGRFVKKLGKILKRNFE